MRTNYEDIASRYDRNPVRRKPVDPEIGTLLEAGAGRLRVVDVACGTGTYLETQRKHYTGDSIEWIGIDRSQEMLSVARSKNPGIRFILDSIEKPGDPVGDADYVRNEFAFHHFEDKTSAVMNISRMLKPGGLFVLVNICPEYSLNSWVYHYFPGTLAVDEGRFLPTDGLYRLLRSAGFEVTVKITTMVKPIDYEKAVAEAQNRDMSQLTLISDEEYGLGIERLKRDRDAAIEYLHDFSLMRCRCTKLA